MLHMNSLRYPSRLFAIGAAIASWVACTPVYADNWSGSIRSKIQTDNRYRENADYTGEVWGQLSYLNEPQQLKVHISTIDRLSTDIYREKQDVYQAYFDKKIIEPLNLKAGRFERSDSLGLYLLDGASANYKLVKDSLSLDVYAGRPVRIDHVRSVQGNYVGGVEGLLTLKPNWSLANGLSRIDNFDLRLGTQVMESSQSQTLDRYPTEQEITSNVFDAVEGTATAQNPSTSQARTTYRINATSRLAGYLGSNQKPAEMFLQASYAAAKNRFENVLVDFWWDPIKHIRLRNYFESYRPKQPFITFRDRFYSAYALGQQNIWRGSAEHAATEKFRYSLGGQYATRDNGYSGQGFNSGFSYQWNPSLKLKGELDYIELNNGENAKSVYLTSAHTVNSKTRLTLNLAWREEDKKQFGSNQARGIENEFQYMFNNSLIMEVKGSYIFNTTTRDEYLGAMQLIYYFDRFIPKQP